MKHTVKIAPVAAALSALATLACCLPFAFAAGTASASLAMVAGTYRWSFLGASVVLLAVGAVQLLQARRACRPGEPASPAILGVRGHRAARRALPTDDCRAARRLDAMNRRTLFLLVLLWRSWVRSRSCASPRTTHPQGNRPWRISTPVARRAQGGFQPRGRETRLIVVLAPT